VELSLKSRFMSAVWALAEQAHGDADDTLCCCGSVITSSTYYNCEGRCKSVKAYAVELEATETLQAVGLYVLHGR
jgi:hypothetical protein